MNDGRFTERFDGAAAWAGLTDEQRAQIGSTALEVVVNWNGMDAYEDREQSRPFDAADSLLLDNLHHAVNEALPHILGAEPLPVPSQLGPVCRRCGCSEQDACFPACGWSEPDLCTACESPVRSEAAAGDDSVRTHQ
tara:strand:- start:351 stop:761 length:411 start_codon:yes stop_codon:yes gene_type:complete